MAWSWMLGHPSEKGARVATESTPETVEGGRAKNKGRGDPDSLKELAEELRARAEAEGIGLVGPEDCSRA